MTKYKVPSEDADLIERLENSAVITACEDPFLDGGEDAAKTLYGQAAARLRALTSPEYGRPMITEAGREAIIAALLPDQIAAVRWNALMRCGRIKMQGSAGVDPITGERRPGSTSVHFGAEFWPDPLPEDYRKEWPEAAARYDRDTKWGVACLTALADVILEKESNSK